MKFPQLSGREVLLTPTLERNEGVLDGAWENALVGLLARLDQERETLSDASSQMTLLQRLLAMVDSVVRFAHHHADSCNVAPSRSLSDAFLEAAMWQNTVRDMVLPPEKSLVKKLWRRFGAKHAPIETTAFRNALDEMPRLLSFFFLAFQERFASTSARDGWCRITNTFLEELDQTLGKWASQGI